MSFFVLYTSDVTKEEQNLVNPVYYTQVDKN